MNVRKMQLKLHKIVSSGNAQIVVTPNAPKIVDISAMNIANVKVVTAEHSGLLRFNVDFMNRCEGDLSAMVHSHQTINENNYTWHFQDKTRMNMQPKRAFDRSLLTAKQL